MTYLHIVLIALGLLAGPVFAKPVPELTKFTKEQVVMLSEALNAGEAASASAAEWEFKRFLLRITAKVGFDIEAVKLELLPEIELVWQKDPVTL